MARKIVLGCFSTILSHTKSVLSHSSHVPDPFPGVQNLEVFKQTISDGRKLLPSRYQSRYVDVLEAVVKTAEFALAQLAPDDQDSRKVIFDNLQDLFTVVAAPIVQLQSSQHQRELKAFLAEISNIYRRFVNDKQVERGSKFRIISPNLDPLGAFSNRAGGPFSLADSLDLPVAFIAKPANEMHFLPLWAADGHEVGHGIVGAVEGLESEQLERLEKNMRAAFAAGAIKTSVKSLRIPGRSGWFGRRTVDVPIEEFMVRLWKAWFSEVSADYAGLANIGLMYWDSLVLFACSMRQYHVLSVDSIYDSKAFSTTDGFEDHPDDLTRALLGIELVRLLKFSDAQAYAESFSSRLQRVIGGRMPESITWTDRKGKPIIAVSLADMQAVIPVVVQSIVATKYDALAKQAFGEILNWTDTDELIVNDLAAKLMAGDTHYGVLSEARHVVGASMLAMENASLSRSGFSKNSIRIHETGIEMLRKMYDSDCIYCQSSNPMPPKPPFDADRLFKHVKRR